MSNRAFITNNFDSTVSVIDTDTNTVIATIPAISAPEGVVVNDPLNTTRVYIVEDGITDSLVVLDTCDNSVITRIAINNPSGVAISPDGLKLYVTSSAPNLVNVIDVATNTVTNTINVGSGADGVAFTPDGSKAYVANSGSDTVSVIDTATETVIATIPTPSAPEGVAVNPAGTKVYVTDFGTNTVSVISTASDTITNTIVVGNSPIGLVFTQDGAFAYVANRGDNTVSVIDTATETVVNTIAVGTLPVGVDITSDGLFVYVANRNSNNVSVISTVTNTVVDTIAVGSGPLSFPGRFIGTVPPFEDLIVTKSFSPSSINSGGTSTLTITVENPNDCPVNNVSFNDVYPAGLINATPSNASADIGTPVAVDGGNSLSWSIATLDANTTATITVDVTSSIAGSYNNDTGAVTGDEASSDGASAILIVSGNGRRRRRRLGAFSSASCPIKLIVRFPTNGYVPDSIPYANCGLYINPERVSREVGADVYVYTKMVQ